MTAQIESVATHFLRGTTFSFSHCEEYDDEVVKNTSSDEVFLRRTYDATYSSRHRSLHTQGESLPAFFYSWPFNQISKRANNGDTSQESLA